MRTSAVLGGVLVIIGLLILFILRDLVVRIILLALGLIGILVGLVLIALGLGLIFGRWWRRTTIIRF
ncbi:MAG: hypothetical protein JRN68_05990 [Nitrososphaerota archaeon]|jgi:dipeptide/tripeptide permease|nr:hypothetical protein [Nitrososphaerota archaeon]